MKPKIHFVTGFYFFDYSMCGQTSGLGTRQWKKVTCKKCLALKNKTNINRPR